MTPKELLEETIRFYAKSSDANGLPVHVLLRAGIPIEEVRRRTIDGVKKGELEVVFEETDLNTHIRRIPRRFKKPFDELVEKCKLENACIYPSPAVIAKRIDLTRFACEPYTERDWKGGCRLDLVYFEPHVLDRYRSDPRYKYSQDWFGGSFTITDDHYLASDTPSRDKSYLQRFGIGYNEAGHFRICVILGDLRDLSPEHQRIWAEHEVDERCTVNEVWFSSCFHGEWSEYGSIYDAIPAELKVINEMTEVTMCKKLFKKDFEQKPPKAYGILLRPTKKEFLNFARALDTMLSENINADFFPPWVRREELQTNKKGQQVLKPVSTIRMLEEWVGRSFKPESGNPVEEISGPLREVRTLRSKASHKEIEDEYDVAYEQRQRDLVTSAAGAIRTLRMILANFPGADSVEVPDWLFECKIKIP